MPSIRLRALITVCLAFLATSGCAVTTSQSLTEHLQALAQRSLLVVAHRGDSGTNPENTLPSFAAAVAKGADMVELDFMQTVDGVLVCFHDEFLDRTTDAQQVFGRTRTKVSDYTLAELQKLDAGQFKAPGFRGTRIPTLEDALRTIQPGSITMIEHKHGEASKLVALLRRMNLVDDVLVQSFDWRFLVELRRLEPRITLGVLGGSKQRPSPVLADIAVVGARLVHWNLQRLQAEDVRSLHAAGCLVCVFTANSQKHFDQAIGLGVDAITTNFPKQLRDHLR